MCLSAVVIIIKNLFNISIYILGFSFRNESFTFFGFANLSLTLLEAQRAFNVFKQDLKVISSNFTRGFTKWNGWDWQKSFIKNPAQVLTCNLQEWFALIWYFFLKIILKSNCYSGTIESSGYAVWLQQTLWEQILFLNYSLF